MDVVAPHSSNLSAFPSFFLGGGGGGDWSCLCSCLSSITNSFQSHSCVASICHNAAVAVKCIIVVYNIVL